MTPRGEAKFDHRAIVFNNLCRVSYDDATHKISKPWAVVFQRKNEKLLFCLLIRQENLIDYEKN
jgi:hypothetical protein